jgi:hypothetical protein
MLDLLTLSQNVIRVLNEYVQFRCSTIRMFYIYSRYVVRLSIDLSILLNVLLTLYYTVVDTSVLSWRRCGMQSQRVFRIVLVT